MYTGFVVLPTSELPIWTVLVALLSFTNTLPEPSARIIQLTFLLEYTPWFEPVASTPIKTLTPVSVRSASTPALVLAAPWLTLIAFAVLDVFTSGPVIVSPALDTFPSSAFWVAVLIGLFASDVLSTFPRPTSVLVSAFPRTTWPMAFVPTLTAAALTAVFAGTASYTISASFTYTMPEGSVSDWTLGKVNIPVSSAPVV